MALPALSSTPRFDIRARGEKKLGYAGSVLHFRPDVADSLFASLTDSWLGEYESSGEVSSWKSDISDDGCPIELSVALGGRSELRFLVEAQTPDMNTQTAFLAGKRLNESLLKYPGVSLERFERVEDLFTPSESSSERFALWHAAVARASGELAFKAYLNPNINGRKLSTDHVMEALRRLGIGDDARFLHELLTTTNTKCAYFSLDLDSSQGSRVKVYVAHVDATLESIERDLSLLPSAVVWDARQSLRVLAGEGPYDQRPILSCFGFHEGRRRSEHTLHIPVRCYADSDLNALGRLSLLAPRNIAQVARQVSEVTSDVPLARSRRHVTYISTRRQGEDARVTLYLTAGQPEVKPAERQSQRSGARLSERPGPPTSERYAPESERLSSPPSEIPPSTSEHGGTAGSETRIKITPLPVVTFDDVLVIIQSEEQALKFHRLLRLLAPSKDLDDVSVVARSLAFFRFGLEDIVRLSASKIRDRRLTSIAWDYFAKTSGRVHPFVRLLASVDGEVKTSELFEDGHVAVRDFTYQLIVFGHRAPSDMARLTLLVALLQAIESVSDSVTAVVHRSGNNEALLSAIPEAGADLPFPKNAVEWRKIRLKKGELADASDAVNSAFSLFSGILDDAAASVEADRRRRSGKA